jgi:O-acetyl-ADP-ribose deacetylase (regulator of RNase III)
VIHYLEGDATDPKVPGNKIIAHVCNDIGGWGRGFVLSLSKKWKEPELQYRRWFQEGADMLLVPGHSDLTIGEDLKLGAVMFVPVAYVGLPPFKEQTFVANMIGQHGIMPNEEGIPPIRDGALEECLRRVKLFADHIGGATVHMPRIGCGLAGGKWSEIEPIIERSLPDVDVYVYDFDTKDARTVPWTK